MRGVIATFNCAERDEARTQHCARCGKEPFSKPGDRLELSGEKRKRYHGDACRDGDCLPEIFPRANHKITNQRSQESNCWNSAKYLQHLQSQRIGMIQCETAS